jgi:apolipoprotein N-acyltransferase
MVKIQRLTLTLVAAFIFSLAFEPVGFWFAAPISLAIYFYLLKRGSAPYLTSTLYAFTSNAIILSWSKTFVGVLPWILLAFLQALYFIPMAFLWKRTRNLTAVISALLVMEELKSRYPFGGFGWTRIGFSQVNSPYAPYFAIVGVIGLSIITTLIALFLVERSRTLILFILSLLFFTPFVISQDAREGSIQVRAVQGGVPERGLDFNARAQAVLDNHIAVTLNEYKMSDQLILWPENSIDVDPFENKQVSDKLSKLQETTGIPLLAGAIVESKGLLNTAVLFDSTTAVKSIYIKRYLTPFGEYIPLRSISSIVSPHTDRVTDFTSGNGLIIHEVDGVNISSVICYELLSDSIIRESARSSDFITVLTNSATFSGSAEGDQQMSITRIRAIESGKNIISVSTTGPSAFINHRGEVQSKMADGEVGSISQTIQVRDSKTLAMRYGQQFTYLVLLLSLLWIARTLRSQEKG